MLEGSIALRDRPRAPHRAGGRVVRHPARHGPHHGPARAGRRACAGRSGRRCARRQFLTEMPEDVLRAPRAHPALRRGVPAGRVLGSRRTAGIEGRVGCRCRGRSAVCEVANLATAANPPPQQPLTFAGAAADADGLPAVVREGLVGLRHAEDVVLPLVARRPAAAGRRAARSRAAAPSSARGGRGRSPRASGRRASGRGAAAPRRAPGRSRRRRGGSGPRAPG